MISIGRIVHIYMSAAPDDGPFAAIVAGVNGTMDHIDVYVFRPIWDTPRLIHRVVEKSSFDTPKYPCWEFPPRV